MKQVETHRSSGVRWHKARGVEWSHSWECCWWDDWLWGSSNGRGLGSSFCFLDFDTFKFNGEHAFPGMRRAFGRLNTLFLHHYV